MPTTDDALSALQEATAHRATPGEWTAQPSGQIRAMRGDLADDRVTGRNLCGPYRDISPADAHFIVTCSWAVPVVTDELAAARQRIEKLERVAEAARHRGHGVRTTLCPFGRTACPICSAIAALDEDDRG